MIGTFPEGIIGGGILSNRGRTPPAVLPLNSRWVAEGDSITAGSVSAQWSQFTVIGTRGRLFQPQNWNKAVGGQTAAQMATQIADTMTPAPKLVTLLAGTNDLGGSSDTPAAIYANILTCVKGYLDGGAQYVVVSRVLPRNDATWLGLGSQPQRETDRQTLNGLIVGLPSDPTLTAYYGRVKIATDIETTFDPTTDTVDGLHPNLLGAAKLGSSFTGGVLPCLDQTSVLTDSYLAADNLLLAAKNPALVGTAGAISGAGGSGQVANGWTVADNGGMTFVASKSTLNGAEAQRIVVSGTNSTNYRVINFNAPATYSGAIGDLVEACIDFTLASGYQNLRGLGITCDTGTMVNNSGLSVVLDGAGPFSGTLRTSVSAPLAATDTSTTLQALLFFATGTVAADVTWGRPYMRKVPSGQ